MKSNLVPRSGAFGHGCEYEYVLQTDYNPRLKRAIDEIDNSPFELTSEFAGDLQEIFSEQLRMAELLPPNIGPMKYVKGSGIKGMWSMFFSPFEYKKYGNQTGTLFDFISSTEENESNIRVKPMIILPYSCNGHDKVNDPNEQVNREYGQIYSHLKGFTAKKEMFFSDLCGNWGGHLLFNFAPVQDGLELLEEAQRIVFSVAIKR